MSSSDPEDPPLRRYRQLVSSNPELFENPPGLRFGLPGDASGWQRLDAALAACARPADAHP